MMLGTAKSKHPRLTNHEIFSKCSIIVVWKNEEDMEELA